MSLTWNQAAVVVDRFVRLVDTNLRELRQQHALIQNARLSTFFQHSLVRLQLEDAGQLEGLAAEKSKADRLVHQLQTALQQVLEIRFKLDASAVAQFDERIEPVRLRIQSTLAALREKRDRPPPKQPAASTNPFDGDADPNFFDDCFDGTSSQTGAFGDYERQLQQEQSQLQTNQRVAELKLRAEQAREDAEATKKLETDIEDLNQVMVDLAQLVHSQHEMVDSIEEQVERSALHVNRGNLELKKAVTHKQTKYPLIAAVVGSVAVGGPVGLAAGSAVAGIGAAIGGAVAGLWGGRAIRQKTMNENSQPDASASAS
ncbi:T-SNARE coiled-coil-like proteiny domain-containing protein [Aphelenchoides fujianensis]|nr:T-SNARE coiled-coil-like proteiny domain-containing protein [Aphelenchoides fujianensis]